MKTNAIHRLQATVVKADTAIKPSEWWDNLPREQKETYLENHPNSKYAEQALKEAQETNYQAPAQLQPGSKERKNVASKIAAASPNIAKTLKHAFPKVTAASGALSNLAKGEKLDHEQKETLHELGAMALKTALSHTIGPHAAKLVGSVGITAVHYAIEKYKHHKDKSKKTDDIEVFVDAVADGVEHAEAAPIPKEHQEPKSSFRSALGTHIKKSAKHVASILDRSFKDIKPATQGLASLAKKQPLEPEQKKALKHMGKMALGTSIALLPGGLAAHLAAGAGAAALTHAYKKMREGEGTGHLVHRFVEAIGEGLEDAILEHAAGEEGGHE